MEEDENEKKSKAKKHPLYRVIGKRPNGWMTAPQLWGMAIVHLCLRGNFYAFKVSINGQTREILPIHPDRVHEVVQNEDWSLTYKIADKGGGVREYPQSKIFHIRGMSYDGITGINPIQYARECIASGLAAERFIGNYFGKGMHPGAVITIPERLKTEDNIKLREAMREVYGGLGNSHDLMLLENGSTITFPAIKLVDQQFLEEQKFTDAQVCGLFGVPLFLVQSGDRPETYASAGEFKRTFVDTVIAPIAVNFETTIDMSLLPDYDQDRFYTKYNLNVLLRGNPKERAEFYKELINCEMMNPNEGRALEDWNPYEGGDEYRTRTSSMKEQTTNTPDSGKKGGK
jgi:HK97 family phage portal protein